MSLQKLVKMSEEGIYKSSRYYNRVVSAKEIQVATMIVLNQLVLKYTTNLGCDGMWKQIAANEKRCKYHWAWTYNTSASFLFLKYYVSAEPNIEKSKVT